MPELPEVENVRIGLSQSLDKDLKRTALQSVKFFRKDLRFPMPQKQLKLLQGQKLLNLDRRGKFLIFNFSKLSFYSHLGMTGHWRIEDIYKPIKHDHFYMNWGHKIWIYNDPRRFGYLGLNPELLKDRFGPDPILDLLSAKDFLNRAQKKTVAIKIWIMDQKNILGVGNIYASEILFKAKINPLRQAQSITLQEWREILKYTKSILKTSIRLGGSTLKDYRKVDGSAGGFQNTWQVYAGQNKHCGICRSPILQLKMSGRATYYCENCQN